jgi:hypothetical protein
LDGHAGTWSIAGPSYSLLRARLKSPRRATPNDCQAGQRRRDTQKHRGRPNRLPFPNVRLTTSLSFGLTLSLTDTFPSALLATTASDSNSVLSFFLKSFSLRAPLLPAASSKKIATTNLLIGLSSACGERRPPREEGSQPRVVARAVSCVFSGGRPARCRECLGGRRRGRSPIPEQARPRPAQGEYRSRTASK